MAARVPRGDTPLLCGREAEGVRARPGAGSAGVRGKRQGQRGGVERWASARLADSGTPAQWCMQLISQERFSSGRTAGWPAREAQAVYEGVHQLRRLLVPLRLLRSLLTRVV